MSYMYTYVPSLSDHLPTLHPPYPSRSPQSTKLSSLCYAAASHQLSVSYIVVYQSNLTSCFTSPSPYTTVSKHLFSMSVSVFLHCKQAHLYHFFRLHIYMLIAKSYLQCGFYYYFLLSLGSPNIKHTCIQDKPENKKIHPTYPMWLLSIF